MDTAIFSTEASGQVGIAVNGEKNKGTVVPSHQNARERS
jgi:hypothetical protein